MAGEEERWKQETEQDWQEMAELTSSSLPREPQEQTWGYLSMKKQPSAHHSPIVLKSLLLLLQATINLILSPLTSLIVPFQCQLVSY